MTYNQPTGASSVGQDSCNSLGVQEFKSSNLRAGALPLGIFLPFMGASTWVGFIVVELLGLVISWTLTQITMCPVIFTL